MLRCARASQASSLLRSFNYFPHNHTTPLHVSSILSATLRTNASLKQRFLHTTPYTRQNALQPSLILRWPRNPNIVNARRVTVNDEVKGKGWSQDARHVDEKVPLEDGAPLELEALKGPGVWRQIFFVFVLSSLVYVGASKETNAVTEKMAQKLRASYYRVTNVELYRALHKDITAEALKRYNSIIANMPNLSQSMKKNLYIAYCTIFLVDESPAKRIIRDVILVNAVVWCMWKIPLPVIRVAMWKMFTHHPMSGKSYTLLTSMFSHESFFHILFNMLAFQSFGLAAYNYLWTEQSNYQPKVLEATTSYHFVAFFVAAGLFASLASHIVSNRIMYPRLLRSAKAASAKAVKSTFKPSLGASGAIYATVTMTALAYPDSNISLIFLPIPMNIQAGVGGLVLLDIMGILFKWRFFDHVAHLGGAIFGVLYFYYGLTMWNQFRKLSEEVLGSDESRRKA